ncbi:LAME_0F15918g1_1 [Lachancea meyersii CBS 8951]|uniref:Required for respiratory growth protein 9, mitochondrial n=1 Tax=Lachancea meyersii CBS 8951 TaxID=1266667 RepID=A0A1G4JYR8_9SACH|nr:LAME_0F15918g1_1 [Lachancea meyersii CBS 8951]
MLSSISCLKLQTKTRIMWQWGFKTKHSLTIPFTVVRRGLQFGPILNKAKTARDLIKLINSTSLTRAESSANPAEQNDARMPDWKRQKLALNRKFEGQQWSPKKKLSREQMESLRLLKQQFPKMTASQLGEHFQVSPEVVRRILKSKWTPDETETSKIQERWKRRSERVNKLYESYSIQGPPPKKLVLGSGRSNPDLAVKSIQRNFKPLSSPSKPSQSTRSKQKLQLLSRLVG